VFGLGLDATADIQLLAHLYEQTPSGNGNGSSAVGSVVDSCPSAVRQQRPICIGRDGSGRSGRVVLTACRES
jgi:hypothetical protein